MKGTEQMAGAGMAYWHLMLRVYGVKETTRLEKGILKNSMLEQGGNHMEYSIRPISNNDRESIMDIFNYYVENSFAAYPENKLPYQAFDILLQMSNGFPTGSIIDQKGKIVGFGMLRAHNPTPTFSQTAEVTYFIHPDHTGKGVGKMLLGFLEKGAVEKSITNMLAHISSLNPNSIKFHQQNGFIECGRFKKVGKKKGQEFDTVWMQKML